jgi:hypothetical protein
MKTKYNKQYFLNSALRAGAISPEFFALEGQEVANPALSTLEGQEVANPALSTLEGQEVANPALSTLEGQEVATLVAKALAEAETASYALPMPAELSRPLSTAVKGLPAFDTLITTLTACLDDAPCRETSRRIYRVLFALALETSRYRGHPIDRITRATFHLPAELLMKHLEIKKSAFYDNLQYLIKTGLIACDAHMGNLRGKMVATGTLWAVSLCPEAVMSGKAYRMKLRRDDWEGDWRDLNADVRAKKTVFNLLHAAPEVAGQSPIPIEGYIEFNTLLEWALRPFKIKTKSDTMTVRQDMATALDAVWELETASFAPQGTRSEVVDKLARRLAFAMGDGSDSLSFWRWLIWQLVRASDLGIRLFDDVAVKLASVLRDIQCDITINGFTNVKNPGRVAVAALSRKGPNGESSLYDILKGIPRTKVSIRPAAVA